MAVRASLLFKTVQNSFFFTVHCTHSTWSYAHKWCNTLQRVFPSKRRAHWSSKNIMQLSCGGGLSWVLMGECDHFFIGNLLLLLRESPLVVDEQFKITKSWGTAIESWKEIEISIFHFHRPLFFSWEIRLQNPQVWSTKKKCLSVTAFWDFHFSPENFWYAGSVDRLYTFM